MRKQFKILIVDDEVEIAEEIAEHLISRGWTVMLVTDADQAISALKSDPRINLVLTDVRMPGLSGHELLAMASKSLKPCPPFIFMSGHEDAIGVVAPVASAMLRKPFSLVRLDLAINQVLADDQRPK